MAGPHTPLVVVDDPDELAPEPPLDEPLLGALASEARQAAIVPPFEPAQVQLNGPLPLMAEAVPALQRPVVGAALSVSLLAAPHAPLTAAGFSEALQTASVPPFAPAQVQLNGPVPLTADAVPVAQRLAVGTLLKLSPFDEPQAPLIGVAFSDAVH